jgi:hypothetical protein
MELPADTSHSTDGGLPTPSAAEPPPAPSVTPATPVTTATSVPPRRSRAPWVVTVVALLAAAAFAFLWQSTSSDLDTAKGALAEMTDERDALQSAEDARVAEEEAFPDVYEIVTKHLSAGGSGVDISGDESYVSIDLTGSALYDTSDLGDALKELGFPNSILDRIGNTRALDGTLSADGEKVTASWTYHPDDGLSLVIERDR